MADLYLVIGALLLGVGVSAWVFEPALMARRSARAAASRTTDPVEATFALDPLAGPSGARQAWPNIDVDLPEVTLTVVVPAYNEESRLPLMLDPCLAYLEERAATVPGFTFEVLVVDDGSSDGTGNVVGRYVRTHGIEKVRLLTLRPNQGKGAAVQKGMLRGRGSLLLMADADGATEIGDYGKLEEALLAIASPAPFTTSSSCESGTSTSSSSSTSRSSTSMSSSSSSLSATAGETTTAAASQQLGVALGSRAHLAAAASAQRAFYRTVLMKGMHLAVALLCATEIKDTQCGFKLFTRRSAAAIFGRLHLTRWAFDVEAVQLAQKLGVPLAEVAVRWREVEGSKLITSKLDIVTASLSMLRDMLCVKLCYLFRIWSCPPLATSAGVCEAAPLASGVGTTTRSKAKQGAAKVD